MAREKKAVDMIGTEMFERTGQRLNDLNREARLWIVWQAMILTTLVGKFRLQKEIVSCHDALAVSRCQAFSRLQLRNNACAGWPCRFHEIRRGSRSLSEPRYGLLPTRCRKENQEQVRGRRASVIVP